MEMEGVHYQKSHTVASEDQEKYTVKTLKLRIMTYLRSIIPLETGGTI